MFGKLSFIYAFRDLIRFFSVQTKKKKVTIYSEGRQYIDHLNDTLNRMTEIPDVLVCYVSSDFNDPTLKLDAENAQTFFIGSGFIRDYFFENLNSDIVIMTMPDLGNSKIKRSKFKTKYVYVPHSLVSLHRVYNDGAFDNFDVLCCGGPHHIYEAKKIFKMKGIANKKLISFGYPRLEVLKRTKVCHTLQRDQVLLAPSWGENGLIESGICFDVIENLINKNFRVILRPHPETQKRSQKILRILITKFSSSSLFFLETDMLENSSIKESQILITDWSGIAFDFAFAFHRPVIFADINKKIRNDKFDLLDMPVAEEDIRNEIGIIWNIKEDIGSAIEDLMNKKINYSKLLSKYAFSFNEKSQLNLLKELGLDT